MAQTGGSLQIVPDIDTNNNNDTDSSETNSHPNPRPNTPSPPGLSEFERRLNRIKSDNQNEVVHKPAILPPRKLLPRKPTFTIKRINQDAQPLTQLEATIHRHLLNNS